MKALVKFAINKYIWNAELGISHTLIVGTINNTEIKLARYVLAVSVSGAFQALTNVGIEAKPSPIAASNIAMVGF